MFNGNLVDKELLFILGSERFFSFSGFVVDNFEGSIGQLIDAINPAVDKVVPYFDFEPAFEVGGNCPVVFLGFIKYFKNFFSFGVILFSLILSSVPIGDPVFFVEGEEVFEGWDTNYTDSWVNRR